MWVPGGVLVSEKAVQEDNIALRASSMLLCTESVESMAFLTAASGQFLGSDDSALFVRI